MDGFVFHVKALGQRYKHTVSTDMVSVNDRVVACQKVAVLLLDINLPDRNGYDLCRLIKPQHPNPIVIFLTANDQESDQIRDYEVGAVITLTVLIDFAEKVGNRLV